MELACIIHSKTPIGHNGLVLLWDAEVRIPYL